jgi:capsular polysaccharide biosynthesis protein
LAAQVRIGGAPETLIMTIRVRDGNPRRAVAIANALAQVVLDHSPAGASVSQQDVELRLAADLAHATIAAAQAQIAQLEAQLPAATDRDRQRLLLAQVGQQRARIDDAQGVLTAFQQQQLSGTTNHVAIIERAVTAQPVASSILQATALAAGGGLALALLVVFLLVRRDDSVQSPEELAQLAGAPVLGVIPSDPRAAWRFPSLPEAPSGEAYHSLGARLNRVAAQRELRTLLIAGADAHAGAHDVAAHLATTLTQLGRQVVLVDVDQRRISVGAFAGATVQAEDIAAPGSADAPPQQQALPIDLFHPARLRSYLAHQMDLALIVAAPPAINAAGLAIAAQVDGVVLLATQGSTRRGAITASVQSLRAVGSALTGMVLLPRGLAGKPPIGTSATAPGSNVYPSGS